MVGGFCVVGCRSKSRGLAGYNYAVPRQRGNAPGLANHPVKETVRMDSIRPRAKRNGTAKPSSLPVLAERWALYCRVSTDEQVDKGTIEAQKAFLRQRVD